MRRIENPGCPDRDTSDAALAELCGARAVYALELVQLFAVDLSVRAEEVQMCAQRLPLAFLLHLLLRELVALPLMHMKNVDLHVFASAGQIGEDSSALSEVPDHVTANVAAENRARQRILEEDLDHLFLFIVSE
jgi:hypothetical protein